MKMQFLIFVTAMVCLLALNHCDFAEELDQEDFQCESNQRHSNNVDESWLSLIIDSDNILFEGDPPDCRDNNYNFYAQEGVLARPLSDYGSWLGLYTTLPDSIDLQIVIPDEGIGEFSITQREDNGYSYHDQDYFDGNQPVYLFITGSVNIEERSCERVIGTFQGSVQNVNEPMDDHEVNGAFNIKIPEIICG